YRRMSRRQARFLNKNKALQGTLAFFLGFFNPLLWLGSLVHTSTAATLDPITRKDSSLETGRNGSKPYALHPLVPREELPPLDGLESLERVIHRTRSGETLDKLLSRSGVSTKERQSWLLAVRKQNSMKRGLRPGKELHFYFTKSGAKPAGKKPQRHLKALEIELDDDWMLTWERGNKGIIFSKRERPYDVEFNTAGGIVESSFTDDALRLGLSPSLVSQLADIFSWDIDFDKELTNGDSFKLVYEKRSRKGKRDNPLFKILAAEIVSRDQKHFALYFEKEEGKGGYYGLDGRSLARAFLRFPLEFSNISSHFTHSRFHPVLKVDRPHHGVDFAAKRGTPVRAVASGKLAYAGWRKGGYGRLVEIEHDSVHSSRYAHLQRFARGMRKGATVKKGQIIGYVGSSGRSTGPHLHYELYKDREYADPLNVEFAAEDTLEPVLLKLFENAKQLLLAELAATPHS
ncbi:MAG: peptidoglycan DD-metalloendopeptidase family protein, partial [Candidatus Binatia bacterium]